MSNPRRWVRHIKNKRVFPWSPALAKSKNVEELSASEAADYEASLDVGDDGGGESKDGSVKPKKIDDTGPSKLPPDFDLNVDVSSFDKPHLQGIAALIPGCRWSKRQGVKKLRESVEERLAELRVENDMDSEPLVDGGGEQGGNNDLGGTGDDTTGESAEQNELPDLGGNELDASQFNVDGEGDE